jgi:hypothetical protein
MVRGLKLEGEPGNVFNDVLKGGHFIEIYGPSGVGKTQLLFTLSVKAVNQNLGKVYFVDTRGTFRPERIAEIARCRGLDWHRVLRRIMVFRPTDLSSFLLAVEHILSEPTFILMIDTLSDPFYESPDPSLRYRLGLLCRDISLTCIERGLLAIAANGVRYHGILKPLGFEYTEPYVHFRIFTNRDELGNTYAVLEETNMKVGYKIERGGINW